MKSIRKFEQPLLFRLVPVSDRAMQVLAEHALTLPGDHPVRALVTNQLQRFAVADDFDYGCPPPVTREQALTLLAGADVDVELLPVLMRRLAITQADLDQAFADNDAEAVMQA